MLFLAPSAPYHRRFPWQHSTFSPSQPVSASLADMTAIWLHAIEERLGLKKCDLMVGFFLLFSLFIFSLLLLFFLYFFLLFSFSSFYIVEISAVFYHNLRLKGKLDILMTSSKISGFDLSKKLLF